MVRHNVRNLEAARAKELLGVELALCTSEVVREADRAGTYWSIEKPASSKLWEFPLSRSCADLHLHIVSSFICANMVYLIVNLPLY